MIPVARAAVRASLRRPTRAAVWYGVRLPVGGGARPRWGVESGLRTLNGAYGSTSVWRASACGLHQWTAAWQREDGSPKHVTTSNEEDAGGTRRDAVAVVDNDGDVKSSDVTVAETKGKAVGASMTLWGRVQWAYGAAKQVGKDVGFGLRLMGSDIAFAVRLLWRSVNRFDKLNRRERRHIRGTVIDLLKLLPFAVVLALPGGSFAVPICLRYFPALLPSTFKRMQGADSTGSPDMEAIKTHISSSLQQRVRQMVDRLDEVQDVEAHLQRLFDSLSADSGPLEDVNWNDVGTAFTESTIADLVSAQDMRVMLRLLGHRPIGGHSLLKFRFLRFVDSIRIDDDLIHRLGVDSLELKEVYDALRRRGISTPEVPVGAAHLTLRQLGLIGTDRRAEGATMAAPSLDAATVSHAALPGVFDGGGDGDVATYGESAKLWHRVATDVQPDVLEFAQLVQARLSLWLDLAHARKVPIALLLHLRIFVSPTDEAVAADTTSNAREALKAVYDLTGAATDAASGTSTSSSTPSNLSTASSDVAHEAGDEKRVSSPSS